MNTKEIIKETIKKNRKELESKFSDFQKSISNIEKEINKENVLEKMNEICDVASDFILSL